MSDKSSGMRLVNVRKDYGKVAVIHGVDLEIDGGDFVVFVGPSGCGKSTLLRMIAGLEEVTDGVIEIGGRDVTDLDPSRRGIAMVFQSYALYPHMSVRENLGFGLSMANVPKDEIARNVEQAATGTKGVSTNIQDVTRAAGGTSQSAGQVLDAASELSEQSERLRSEVEQFIEKVRAA